MNEENRNTKETAYIKVLAATVFLFYCLVVSINLKIDPRGMLVSGEFNKEIYFSAQPRVEKSIRILNNNYDTIILGSSRAEVGIDPKSEILIGKSTYNLGLSATNMYEICSVFDFLVRQEKEPDTYIIGLDFLMFTTNREYHPDYNNSAFKAHNYPKMMVDYLTSLSVLKESIITGYKRYKGDKGIKVTNGYIDKTGVNVNHRQLFDAILRSNFLVSPATYAGYKYSEAREECFFQKIDGALARKKKVYLFISPIHARQEEAISVMELYEVYEDWKRRLVNRVEAASAKHNTLLKLWDFSGYNEKTIEAIPEDAGAIMSWYWESSHYKKELGNIVLSRMYGYDGNNNFGVVLNAKNIEEELSFVRNRQQEYREKHPEEILDVKKIYNDVTFIRNYRIEKKR